MNTYLADRFAPSSPLASAGVGLEAWTTAEPPVCRVCGGYGYVREDEPGEGIGCVACGGYRGKSGCGYERGETASLLAMVDRLARVNDGLADCLACNEVGV